MKGSVVWTMLVSFFCLSHYHVILNTAIFWIYMLQYFMWLQVFVLLWINVSFCVLVYFFCGCIFEFSCCQWKNIDPTDPETDPNFPCSYVKETTGDKTFWNWVNVRPLKQLFLSLTGSDCTNKSQNTENILFWSQEGRL